MGHLQILCRREQSGSHLYKLSSKKIKISSKKKSYAIYISLRMLEVFGSGGAMMLGKLPVPGHPTIWITEGQGPTALAVGTGGGCFDIFTLYLSFLSDID